jgi:hypothetical protein
MQEGIPDNPYNAVGDACLKVLNPSFFMIWSMLELEIKHKHGGFNINYEKATVVWQQFGFAS